jgi:hypothetical protein
MNVTKHDVCAICDVVVQTFGIKADMLGLLPGGWGEQASTAVMQQSTA